MLEVITVAVREEEGGEGGGAGGGGEEGAEQGAGQEEQVRGQEEGGVLGDHREEGGGVGEGGVAGGEGGGVQGSQGGWREHAVHWGTAEQLLRGVLGGDCRGFRKSQILD